MTKFVSGGFDVFVPKVGISCPCVVVKLVKLLSIVDHWRRSFEWVFRVEEVVGITVEVLWVFFLELSKLRIVA